MKIFLFARKKIFSLRVLMGRGKVVERSIVTELRFAFVGRILTIKLQHNNVEVFQDHIWAQWSAWEGGKLKWKRKVKLTTMREIRKYQHTMGLNRNKIRIVESERKRNPQSGGMNGEGKNICLENLPPRTMNRNSFILPLHCRVAPRKEREKCFHFYKHFNILTMMWPIFHPFCFTCQPFDFGIVSLFPPRYLSYFRKQ